MKGLWNWTRFEEVSLEGDKQKMYELASIKVLVRHLGLENEVELEAARMIDKHIGKDKVGIRCIDYLRGGK